MIHRLELHNFKCFENAEIKCSPLTVLCGVNSCGKSSVIQAVLLLEETRCSTGMIDLMNMQHGTVLYSFDEILYDDAEDDKIRIGITMMGKSVNLILHPMKMIIMSAVKFLQRNYQIYKNWEPSGIWDRTG